MKCLKCQFENPEDSVFCLHCGKKLEFTCPECGEWMRGNHRWKPFERYADDIVVHCKTECQARYIRESIEERLAECGLELHREKTRILYCKDARRRQRYANVQFDFLGFSFRPRSVQSRTGRIIVGFNTAVSRKATKAMRDVIRSWRLHRRTWSSLETLSRWVNPTLRGRVNYYGSYYRSALSWVFVPLEFILTRWAMGKYKRLRGHLRRALSWLQRVRTRAPHLFAHWQLASRPAAGQ
jgi:RNA-directed DNA polymerase